MSEVYYFWKDVIQVSLDHFCSEKEQTLSPKQKVIKKLRVTTLVKSTASMYLIKYKNHKYIHYWPNNVLFYSEEKFTTTIILRLLEAKTVSSKKSIKCMFKRISTKLILVRDVTVSTLVPGSGYYYFIPPVEGISIKYLSTTL